MRCNKWIKQQQDNQTALKGKLSSVGFFIEARPGIPGQCEDISQVTFWGGQDVSLAVRSSKRFKVSVVGSAATVVESFTSVAHTIPGDEENILGYDIGATLAETTNPSINISYTCVRGMLHYNVFMGDKVAGT